MQSNNSTNFIGVIYDKTRGKWRAEIMYGGKKIFLGRFNNIEDAKISRLNAEFEYFGKDFAPQKHLFDYYKIPTR